MYLAIKQYETITYLDLTKVRKAEDYRGNITLYFADGNRETLPVTRELRGFLQNNISISIDLDTPPQNLVQMPETIKR